MSETEHSFAKRDGHVPCELRQYPASEVMKDGCVETGPEVLRCLRLANGNIGLVFPRIETDHPVELAALEEAFENSNQTEL
ncbi:MAG TPA: hypothetical protein VN778_04340 [Verrucomicrobiae bacterium]|nr:hypothetical protein [Verrucomicrobiae bacterium]